MAVQRPPKLTIEMPDAALLRAVKHASVDAGMPIKEIVMDALREWLERREDAADVAAMNEVVGDERVPFSTVREDLARRRAEDHGRPRV